VLMSQEKNGVGNSEKPNISQAPKAGSFSGDVRDISPAAPTRKERPKRQEPTTIRNVYKKPTVIKPNPRENR